MYGISECHRTRWHSEETPYCLTELCTQERNTSVCLCECLFQHLQYHRGVLQVLEEAIAANYPVLVSNQDDPLVDHTLPTRFGDGDRNRALVLLRRNQRRPSDQP